MLYEFRDNVYLEYKGLWFVWEPAWESFRPIQGIFWNGNEFEINDREYCSDPMDPLYGYGSEKMRQVCQLLKGKRDDVEQNVQVLPMDNLEWFRDRRVPMNSCTPKDILSWKRLVKNKARTCRNAPRGKKFTRRIL